MENGKRAIGGKTAKILAKDINKTYTVIVQPQEERQSLQKIMSEISGNAKTRG